MAENSDNRPFFCYDFVDTRVLFLNISRYLLLCGGEQ